MRNSDGFFAFLKRFVSKRFFLALAGFYLLVWELFLPIDGEMAIAIAEATDDPALLGVLWTARVTYGAWIGGFIAAIVVAKAISVMGQNWGRGESYHGVEDVVIVDPPSAPGPTPTP